MNLKPAMAALAAVMIAASAYAMDLQSAKKQGLVGELPTGYIGAVTGSGDASSVVQSVNAQRKQAYMAISKENGQTLDVVEKLAAQKLYEKLQSGEYYQSGGSWKQK